MKRGAKHSAEARAKMARRSVAKWQDPEYRARMLPKLLALKPTGMGRPKGTKQPAEAIEKTRQATIHRWKDPEYRSRHLPRLLAVASKGLKAARKVVRPSRRILPPEGTPEFAIYCKIRAILGAEVARATL